MYNAVVRAFMVKWGPAQQHSTSQGNNNAQQWSQVNYLNKKDARCAHGASRSPILSVSEGGKPSGQEHTSGPRHQAQGYPPQRWYWRFIHQYQPTEPAGTKNALEMGWPARVRTAIVRRNVSTVPLPNPSLPHPVQNSLDRQPSTNCSTKYQLLIPAPPLPHQSARLTFKQAWNIPPKSRNTNAYKKKENPLFTAFWSTCAQNGGKGGRGCTLI